ncbi:hypothetical protein, partial [Limnospira sp. PMC 1042.18]|uniref:hypothetical protein n=1 Tax=Limnospira sp. PMC 1042.18 TaxID=2981018 RepID=UPI0028E0BC6D
MPPHPNLPQKPPFSTPQPIPRRHFLVGWQVRSLYTTQSDSIAQDRKLRTYNGEDEMTKKTQNAS